MQQTSILVSYHSPHQFLHYICTKHHQELSLYARGTAGKLQEGDELLNMFYLKLYNKYELFAQRYDDYGVSYLKRTIKNISKDGYRVVVKNREKFTSIDETIFEIPERQTPNYSTTIYDQQLLELQKMLKPATFNMLMMKINGYSNQDISQEMVMSSQAVDTRLSRMRTKVKPWLSAQF